MSRRAAQLDGLRAISMIAISWDHWLPKSWPRLFPFEIFLFFFLVLTGYLITGGLLRERDRREASGTPWKKAALKNFHLRRGLRILAPYYAAFAFALLVFAEDAWKAPLWYLLHLSNLHMATLAEWPGGTSHFWSLAMQQQFYLLWPFVIWFLPRKWLAPAIIAVALVAPCMRHLHSYFSQFVERPELITWASLDYFAIGSLFAWAVHRGMSLESPGLRLVSWLGFAIYLLLFTAGALDFPAFGLRPLQQTALSIALCGFIAAAFVGFGGPAKRLLESAPLQKIGQLSYGVYLYHNLAPLAAGKILPWIFWNPWFESVPGFFVRLLVFAAITWGLTLASWRWLEQPLQGVRGKLEKRSA
ncbi:MAG: acyltransferase [Luteolibacter sp.]